MKTSDHLHHIEDLVFCKGTLGVIGSWYNQRFVFDDLLNHSVPSITTVKMDGAPAFLCGPVPSEEKYAGEFFVGTKSVFNKTAKYYTRHNYNDIDAENKPGKAAKIKALFDSLQELDLPYVVQGDAMWTSPEEVKFLEDEKTYAVRPNVIHYRIKDEAVKLARVGVVFHTVYSGSSFAKLRAHWNMYPHVASLTEMVYVINNVRPRRFATLDNRTFIAYVNTFEELMAHVKTLNENPKMEFGVSCWMENFIGNKESEEVLKYFNTFIRRDQMFKPIEDTTTDLMALVPKGDILTDDEYRLLLQKMVSLYFAALRLKDELLQMMLYEELPGINCRIHHDGLLGAIAGEGLVHYTGYEGVKLINRRIFSFANFNQKKDWS